MFYVCLNGKGTGCEYLNSGFNYQSAFPPWSTGGLGAGAAEPGSLAAVGGECRAGWRAEPGLEGAGEPAWRGQGLQPAWLGYRCLTVVLRDVLSNVPGLGMALHTDTDQGIKGSIWSWDDLLYCPDM